MRCFSDAVDPPTHGFPRAAASAVPNKVRTARGPGARGRKAPSAAEERQ